MTDNGGTLNQLLDAEFDPIRWIIHGVLPEGLCFLTGAPKLGKSWLTLSWALSVTQGAAAMCNTDYPTGEGDVLYIGLEDSERRLQSRVITLLNGDTPNPEHLTRFHYRTDWPTLDKGGYQQLDQWLTEHPDARIVVIDTFAKVRGAVAGKDRYTEDYQVAGQLQTLALNHRIALVLVHHHRKAESEDWLDRISGTQAIAGAADTLVALFRERGRMDATLRITGRDVDETDLALQLTDGSWRVLGDAEQYRLTQERADVIDAIIDLGGNAKVHDIAAELDKAQPATSKLLRKLAKDGYLNTEKFGHYSLSTYRDDPTTPPTPEEPAIGSDQRPLPY